MFMNRVRLPVGDKEIKILTFYCFTVTEPGL